MSSSQAKLFDLYGFEIQPTVQQQAERLESDATSEREVYTWKPFIEKNKLPNENKCKDLIRKGVPPTLRTWVWMETSGAAKKKASVMAANYYQNMVLAGSQSKFLKDIDQDTPHTLTNQPWLQDKAGQDALRRVLSAYSVHNTRIGYCRSMNNIVAMLLVCMNRNEENAFWLLAALVEDILHPSTYAKNLEGCQVEMKALDELMSHKLPRLYQHFQQLECDISIIATDWYLCLFTTSMPSETVARVWDSLFNEGPKIIFRVALALLKMHEDVILKANNAGDVMMTVRQAAVHMHHRDKLMTVAFDGIGSLPMAVIEKYREQRQQEVDQAIAEREALKRRQDLKEALTERNKQQQEREKELEADMDGMKLDEKLDMMAKGAAKGVKEGFGKLMGHLTVMKDNIQAATAAKKQQPGEL